MLIHPKKKIWVAVIKVGTMVLATNNNNPIPTVHRPICLLKWINCMLWGIQNLVAHVMVVVEMVQMTPAIGKQQPRKIKLDVATMIRSQHNLATM
jgi:hypothetical protein